MSLVAAGGAETPPDQVSASGFEIRRSTRPKFDGCAHCLHRRLRRGQRTVLPRTGVRPIPRQASHLDQAPLLSRTSLADRAGAASISGVAILSSNIVRNCYHLSSFP